MKSGRIGDPHHGAQVQTRKIERAIMLPLALDAALFLGSCSGLPHSNEVIATVTPAQATVPVGGNVELVGNAVGFTATPVVRWWVQEAKNASDDGCGYLEPQLFRLARLGT